MQMNMELAALNNDVEDFYRFCAEHPNGVSFADLAQADWSDKGQVIRCANMLTAQGRLKLTQLGGGQFLYQAIDPSVARKFAGLQREEQAVYQEIEKTGNKGAWTKVLKENTTLQQHTVTKCIKELIRRGLIKEVKSVQFKGRKVYMLADVEPDKAVSGGTWYQDGEFAASWIASLRERCLKFLVDHPMSAPSAQDLHNFIQEQPGPSTPTVEDIQSIMRTLELDEIVFSQPHPSGMGQMYALRNRANPGELFDIFAGRLPQFAQPRDAAGALGQPGQPRKQPEGPAGLVVPCLLCPVQAECHVGGRISPEKCEYIAAWLQNAGGCGDAKMHDW